MQSGLPNRRIADPLVISVGIVKCHTANNYRKLGVETWTQAIRASARPGTTVDQPLSGTGALA